MTGEGAGPVEPGMVCAGMGLRVSSPLFHNTHPLRPILYMEERGLLVYPRQSLVVSL